MSPWWAEALLGALVTLLFYLLRRADSSRQQLEHRVRLLETEATALRSQVWKEEKITRTINRAVKAAFNEFKIEWLTEEKRKLERETVKEAEMTLLNRGTL
jgi:hypothetical protein